MRPTIFLDLDDVICLNSPYGGYDVLTSESNRPVDLYERLWHRPAVEVLLDAIRDHNATVVLTTSWVRFLDRRGFDDLFRQSELVEVADRLHAQWEAPQASEGTRLTAIEGWLSAWHKGEPFVVIDDALSGTGLQGSWLDLDGRLVLCEVDVGLQLHHGGLLRHALSSPYDDLHRKVVSRLADRSRAVDVDIDDL